MAKDKVFKTTIIVASSEITVTSTDEINNDYIPLTDMTKNFEGGSSLIEKWLRNKDTILFMGTWEKLHNADFNSLEFEGIKNENMNANLIEKGLSQQERLMELNNIARNQLKSFLNSRTIKKIKNLN